MALLKGLKLCGQLVTWSCYNSLATVAAAVVPFLSPKFRKAFHYKYFLERWKLLVGL